MNVRPDIDGGSNLNLMVKLYDRLGGLPFQPGIASGIAELVAEPAGGGAQRGLILRAEVEQSLIDQADGVEVGKRVFVPVGRGYEHTKGIQALIRFRLLPV